ncbi:MAG: DUF523 domain-containing protein [Oscillospiraceae bacterium]|nr:DUF523 domain-containing protein [Oscillospiraceae bacterium]
MNVLISACLLGLNCKYSGGNNENTDALRLLHAGITLIPICPEVYGGLPTPREPSERCAYGVISKSGKDVTAQYRRGAEAALLLAKRYDVKFAIFKERSPSCGCGEIYDGSFTGTLIPGDGVTAELLKENGISVIGESQIRSILNSGGQEQ